MPHLTPFMAFQSQDFNDHTFKESLRLLYGFLVRLSTHKTITPSDSPYAVASDDYLIRCNCTNGAITINLPPSEFFHGLWFIFKKIDSTANAVTISRDGSDLIDGATSVTLSTQYDFIQLYCPKEGLWDIIAT